MPIGKIKTYWADFEKAKPGDKLPVGYRWRRRKGRWLIVSKNGEYDHSAVK
jgi:hypothetical protein